MVLDILTIAILSGGGVVGIVVAAMAADLIISFFKDRRDGE